MKKLFLIGLALTFFGLSGCEEDDSNSSSGALQVSIVGTGIVIIEDDTFDCTGDAVASDRFYWSGIRMTWSDPFRDFRLLFIKVEIVEENLGGEFTAILADEQLDRTLLYQGDVDPSDPTAPAPSVIIDNTLIPAPLTADSPRRIENVSSCRIHVGGLNVVDQDRNFDATAVVTVFAISSVNAAGVTNGAGELGDERTIRVSTTAPVTFNLN